jgi:hypothetical protein
MTDLRIDPSAANRGGSPKRGHDKVRALLPELPTGLPRRLHDGAKCVSLMGSDDNAERVFGHNTGSNPQRDATIS